MGYHLQTGTSATPKEDCSKKGSFVRKKKKKIVQPTIRWQFQNCTIYGKTNFSYGHFPLPLRREVSEDLLGFFYYISIYLTSWRTNVKALTNNKYYNYTIVTWKNNHFEKNTIDPLRWTSIKTPNITWPPNTHSLLWDYDYTNYCIPVSIQTLYPNVYTIHLFCTYRKDKEWMIQRLRYAFCVCMHLCVYVCVCFVPWISDSFKQLQRSCR